jgi:RNA polymerase sigma-70 factor (ECF subfamily)
MTDERNNNEKELLESAIQGEASAFGLLYDKYQPSIFRFVFLKVSQREEAEDLTHQVFINAWLNIKNYKELGFPLGSWLYQIARNQVIDYYRTRKKEASLEEIDSEYFASSNDSERAFDNNLEIARARVAIQKLNPEHQDVLIMRFVEDLSLKETAAAIGKSEGAVKLIQHRALNQLRKLLA